MAYSPTEITTPSVDSGEMVLHAPNIEDNLENISLETKSLNDSIRENTAIIVKNNQDIEQIRHSYQKLFFDF